MALNVRLAVMLSFGFIGGMTWLVNAVSLPMAEVSSPLLVHGSVAGLHTLRDNLLRGGGVARASEPRVSRKFEQPSAFEVEAARRGAMGSGASAVLVDRPTLEPAFLPPLASRVEAARLAVEDVGGVDGDVMGEVVGVGREVGVSSSRMGVVAGDVETREESGSVVRSGGSEEEAVVVVGGGEEAVRRPAARSYRVRRGDTLVAIARRHYGTDEPEVLAALMLANPRLENRPDKILVGETLVIPGLSGAGESGEADVGVKLVSGEGESTGVSGLRWYTVKKRDSLSSIAERFLSDSSRWREILELNRIKNAHRIYPGMRIKLPPLARMAQG